MFVNDDARLMIMNSPGLNTGLVVHEVLGLRHFDAELERQDLSGLDDPVLAHLNGAFLHDNVLWGVFDMKSLADAPSFRTWPLEVVVTQKSDKQRQHGVQRMAKTETQENLIDQPSEALSTSRRNRLPHEAGEDCIG